MRAGDKKRVLSLLGECIERAVGHGVTAKEIRETVEAALAKKS
jgi:hypothetical protein